MAYTEHIITQLILESDDSTRQLESSSLTTVQTLPQTRMKLGY